MGQTENEECEPARLGGPLLFQGAPEETVFCFFFFFHLQLLAFHELLVSHVPAPSGLWLNLSQEG